MLRLRNILANKGIHMKQVAEVLGISEKALYNKLAGASEFNYREICKLKTIIPEYDIDYALSEAKEGTV